MRPEDASNADNYVAMKLVAAHGFECTEKVQWGEQQFETDCHGHNLTFKYIKNGNAIQFYLSPSLGHDNVYQEFFYISSPEQETFFHENFIPWILTSLWEEEEEECKKIE